MNGAELLAELEAMPSAKWTEGPTALDVEAEVTATIHRHMIEEASSMVAVIETETSEGDNTLVFAGPSSSTTNSPDPPLSDISVSIHRHMIEDAEAAFWASIAAREAGSGTIGPVEALE